ncbi:MAG TPA: cytochrome C oxidase subunit IV family protein [Gammaproteobacteria bacterium]|nr:cytochrome C oxidase subunit IV family protein [Gammaproteobacteria bacterium]
MKLKIKNPWLQLTAVWLAMLCLFTISVGLAFAPIGVWHSVINLIIAGILVMSIMTFFMHLKDSEGLLRLTAGTGFFWLIILFTLSLADYFSRYSF